MVSAGFLFIALISKLNHKNANRYLRYSDPDAYLRLHRAADPTLQDQQQSRFTQFRSGESDRNAGMYEDFHQYSYVGDRVNVDTKVDLSPA